MARLQDLVDLDILKDLMDAFYRSTGVGSTIIDLHGNILMTTTGRVVGSEAAWQRVCLNYHRAYAASEARCRSSDIFNAQNCLGRATPFYTCFNGMIDSATPIVIDGEHLATIFSGQYFFEPPDRSYFQNQAREFGFPEEDYLAALDEVPILPREHVEHCLTFLSLLARVIAEMGLSYKARSTFFSAASHDLRQPLQGLRLFLDVLEQDTRGGPLETKVKHASQALAGAEMIVRSLLDVARQDAALAPPDFHSVDIARLFGALADEIAPQAAAKGLRLRVAGARGTVWSDILMLERILRNLLVNAVRYTERGGILLACRRRRGTVLLEVWDTGLGIPDEHREAIWEEFYQVANPERNRDRGLGLGLPIVRKLTQRLGHRITLCSRVGQGSRFRLLIDQKAVGN